MKREPTPVVIAARFRFYGKLRDFLPWRRRGKSFPFTFKGRPAVKDTLEALGVPHPEVDLILANGRSVDFSHRLQGGDRVAVYPPGPFRLRGRFFHLQPPLPKNTGFVIDCHLGKLARRLRLLGFDAVYRRDFSDAEIVETAVREKRIVLTRDVGLLKNKQVGLGYWVRSQHVERQLKEVIARYGLRGRFQPFVRCLECNGRIRPAAKRRIQGRLLPKTRAYFNRFYQCPDCGRVYWRGSHYPGLKQWIRKAG